jgi:hypothetical protein
VSLWEQRAAHNEALFRQVNENIADLEWRLRPDVIGPLSICECSSADCSEQLPDVGLAVYEETRKDPRRFFVAPGHENLALERAVGKHPRFLIVEKTGEAGKVAEQTQD